MVLLVQEVNKEINLPKAVDVYVVYSGEGATLNAFQMAERIRSELPQLGVMTHCSGGNFKKQFKRADKVEAQIALVIGESEVEQQTVVLKRFTKRCGTSHNRASGFNRGTYKTF
ncbi:histidyl-tRNA synthetase [Actinobacillus pleuropneumoniae]|nr:histidyl-tRNA synthetase [Actinobacillus pleuropneumoniae]